MATPSHSNSHPQQKSELLGKALIIIGAAACLLPQVSSAVALVAGMAIAMTAGNPYLSTTKKITPKLLSYSVVALGAAMNLHVVAKVGLQGFGYTITGIIFAMVLGSWISRRLGIKGDTGLLVTVGTAICGGSAIAAVSPAVQAKSEETSVALATVFCLNALALVTFPALGHAFDLTQHQFGLWAALAIHDTSSVVGATLQYGTEALSIGTTVKLARALWIVPLVFVIVSMRKRADANSNAEAKDRPKAKKPWFILGFLATAALVTYIPALREPGEWVAVIARRGLVITLFLIGASLTRATLKSVGARPLVLGVLLWLIVGSGSLAAIKAGLIH